VRRTGLPSRRLLREALDALGIRRFLLGVHDAAFPMLPGEDVGRGTPYSDGAAGLLALASSLGFDGLQLGPQGTTSPVNPSPYEGTLFSRSPLSIALAPLARPDFGELLSPADVEAATSVAGGAGRVAHEAASAAVSRALAVATERFRALRATGDARVRDLASRLEAFRAAESGWLLRDALYEVLQARHGGAGFRGWPDPLDRRLLAPAPGDERAADERRRGLLARHAAEVEAYAFAQLLAHDQHHGFRDRAKAHGLALFADLQVGMSDRDAWASQGFVLDGWRMGAPPSRTNPAGQPWGFAVLDPDRARAPDGGDGPALAFARARARKAFREHQGLRVDHPHGLVCPWVYRAGGDPAAEVARGARLFDSPEVPDLAGYAIARRDQLDLAVPRHADGRVTALEPEQVRGYSTLFDALVAEAPGPDDLACEVLSTLPYPLARVLERHRLGRFRITHKADFARPGDVYRSDSARPEDWIMLGNHDTRTIWQVAERWVAAGEGRRTAEYLAGRLLPRARADEAESWARATAADPRRLAQAAFADLFVGPARHVHVYFTDLLGSRERYNAPGTVSDANWSLRIPADVARVHAARASTGDALDVPRALATALRARGGASRLALAEALDPQPGA
jgi:4-alpha-glucanotransferase